MMEGMMTSAPQEAKDVIVRFYLIRHGETLDNKRSIVVGQGDSALSDHGRQQAVALGVHSHIAGIPFWRRWSSDLGRAKETAQLIDKSAAFHPDPRLREIAKGVRQGNPKNWTYEMALNEFKSKHGMTAELPFQETLDEAWDRIFAFFYEALSDAVEEASSTVTTSSIGQDRPGDGALKIPNAMVVSHSGTLRLLLHKLVPYADPLLLKLDDTLGPLESKHRFKIPNTSVTILDLKVKNPTSASDWPYHHKTDQIDQDLPRQSPHPSHAHEELFTAELVDLNWTGHIQ